MCTNSASLRSVLDALDSATTVVKTITAGDLIRPTPCARWNLRQLVEHMIGQHIGFAQAMSTGDAQLIAFRPKPITALSLQDVWSNSLDQLRAALKAAPPDATVRLAEIDPVRLFDGPSVLGIQLLDTVIHTWDVATALGQRFRPDADIVDQVAAVADRIPSGEARNATQAFGQPQTTPTTGDVWISTLTHLGRRAAPRRTNHRRTVSSGALWAPLVGYSRAVRIGQFIAVAGTTASGPDGPIGGDDPAEQTREAIRRIAAALDELDASLNDVVRTRIFVTDISRWEEVGRAHGEAFGDIRPAASMIEINALIDPALQVEIEADAWIEGADRSVTART